MTISRRALVAALAATPAAALLPRRVHAAGYPDKPIFLIVPFAAGGNADIVARLVGAEIGRVLGQNVVIENRGGAGGAIGAEYVARAAADGYTLLAGSNGPLTVNPFVHPRLGYDPLKDFAPIALTSYVPHALVMSSKSGAKTFADALAQSRTAALAISTSGVGSATHMTLERLKAATGANITHVPYKSGGQMVPDLIGGEVSGAMTELSTALPLHRDGKAVIVAVAAARRARLAPDIPTFDEAGVKGFSGQSFVGILAPAATPADIIAKLQTAVATSLAPGASAAERLADLGAELGSAEQMTAKGFGDFIRADYEAMREAARLAGI